MRNLKYRDTTLIKISARKNVSVIEIKILKSITLRRTIQLLEIGKQPIVPKRNKNILCEVFKGDTFVTEPSEVLDVWASEFSSLYNNPSEVSGDIDVDFLNKKIGFHEVEKTIKGLKKQSMGYQWYTKLSFKIICIN